ncbi:hypothetical protein [Sandaracinus amylolyticus]|uniref:hypothetical protein n=1 Tax=Sandaracinus amylolyticus TaxID=927083 RepID=UPI001F252606|nr:hypothetical protein [Sandaracinus amylolyticus]UJR78760.1 Hypothetical protein I5071_7920 [Sandaracinus amylolyticus]
MRHAIVAGVMLLAAACSSDEPLACTPGATLVCACSRGGAGERVCDGEGFGDCLCDGRAVGTSIPIHVGTNDAGTARDASTPRDSAVDALRDAESDAEVMHD